MLNLTQRLDSLRLLREYMLSDDGVWMKIKEVAEHQNAWFTNEFINEAVQNIAKYYLNEESLSKWVTHYNIPDQNDTPSNVGITMAGNIPLVGFHDFLCTFVTGNKQSIKLSVKDNVLLKHLANKLIEWNVEAGKYIEFRDTLKGCDAYIATGSNNSARYFEYYFRKYPSIIRKNRTSVAILSGKESDAELSALADDVYIYFGLGCRNVTKIFVPQHYDFVPLLNAFKKYDRLIENHKYKHNYDYNLAIHMINQKFYMTNGSIILIENPSVFSPISEIHYQFYSDENEIYQSLNPEEIQCIAGKERMPLGSTQKPGLSDYADEIDTLQFLLSINNKPA